MPPSATPSPCLRSLTPQSSPFPHSTRPPHQHLLRSRTSPPTRPHHPLDLRAPTSSTSCPVTYAMRAANAHPFPPTRHPPLPSQRIPRASHPPTIPAPIPVFNLPPRFASPPCLYCNQPTSSLSRSQTTICPLSRKRSSQLSYIAPLHHERRNQLLQPQPPPVCTLPYPLCS